jgi:DNA-binding CsgD family transcriptional regulator
MQKIRHKFFSITAVANIKTITAPLRQFGICHFNHDITFGNDKMAMLTDNSELFKLYYDQQLPVICTNETGRILDTGIYLTKSLAHENKTIANIIAILDKKYNFHNSLLVIERENDCQHMFTLTSPLDEHTFLNKIINNLDNIKNFLEFYKISAKDIIRKAKEPRHQIGIINSTDFDKTTNANLSPSLVNIKLSTELELRHKDTNKILTLTVKQSECLKLLLKSYSAKEIARAMNLSHRTIEHYIEYLRGKLNCRNAKELIANYSPQITLK